MTGPSPLGHEARQARDPDPAGDLLGLEADGDLFSFRSAGVPIWWFVRPRFYWLLRRQATGLVPFRDAASLGVRAKLGRLLGAAGSFQVLGGRWKAEPLLALSVSSARRHRTPDGRDYDVFFDFLSAIPGLGYVVAEFPDHKPHSRQPYSRNVVHADWLALLGNAGRSLAGLQRPDQGAEALAETLVRLLTDRGYAGQRSGGERSRPAATDPAEVRRLIYREAAFIRATRAAVNRFLDLARPRVVLTECGYSPSHMVVQYSAKQRGIPVVELQHGLISAGNVAYRFSARDAEKLRDSPFPDRICVYGDYFRRVLLERPGLRPENIVVTGHPYLWALSRGSVATREALPGPDGSGSGRTEAGSTERRSEVLITSQPGLGEFWARFAVELADRIGRPVVLKPHPNEASELRSVFKVALGHPNVTVARADAPIYELLASAAFHLSVFSTTHLEALALGVKDIIVACNGLEKNAAFLADHGVPVASGPAEAVRLIRDYPDVAVARDFVARELFGLDRNPVQVIGDLLRPWL